MKYKIYIIDFEVFAHDWLIVISDTEGKDVKVIHNNNADIQRFMSQSNIIIGGYNNKHYDDFIMMTILKGGKPEDVKACNDWIIAQGKQGYEFPLIKGSRKPFVSFDLMDDIPVPLGLKAIEANIGEKIVESSVSFNIDHPLSEAELQETIYYCKSDVANTVKLYHLRKSYLDGKIAVGKLKGWDEAKSLPPTNPILTARFLDARLHDYNDEFTFDPPASLQLGKYQFLLDFYKNVDYSKTLDVEVAGIKHKYGWGGLHASVEHYQDESTPEWRIVDIDVGSMYPTIMLNWTATSRSIPSAEGYAEVYHRRLKAKHEGRKDEANALKLVLNSTYGAMKNGVREEDSNGKRTGKIIYANPLYDARQCNRVCLIGQLFITDLISHLESIPSFSLIQTNTDGLMIKYNISDEQKVKAIVDEWQTRSKMTMEYKLIKKIACMKDVNNYIIVEGETWLFNNDGTKRITDQDKNKITAKGGWVSQWEGGTWKNNSLSIVHKALVNYFVYGKNPQQTIDEETDIFKFQIVCKTGSTYNGTVWSVNGKDVPVQKVNRVYASNDERYGLIYKMKDTSKTKIADLPEHCIVDNENKCTIDDINKKYYVDLAWKRIKDYMGIVEEKPKKERKKKTMATTKPEDYSKVNPAMRLLMARMDFLQSNAKKTGINRFAEFKYFELDDIVPVAIPIMTKYGLLPRFTFIDDSAYALIHDAYTYPEDTPLEFMFKMKDLSIVSNTGKNKMNEMQGVGACQTYARRYLWNLVLDIVEHDAFDATLGKDDSNEEQHILKNTKPVVIKKEERKEAVQEMTSGKMDEVDKTSIQAGLKKLKALDKEGIDTAWIGTVWSKAKSMEYSKEEAEKILIEIGEKVSAKEGK